MKGRPLSVRCPVCKLRPNHVWRIFFTGQTKKCKVQRPGRCSGADEDVKYLNRCSLCGHVWWSTYKGVTDAKVR